MKLRLLCVLLIELNIAVGAWLLLGQSRPHAFFAADPGVPTLHLLSELPPANPSTAHAAAARTAAVRDGQGKPLPLETASAGPAAPPPETTTPTGLTTSNTPALRYTCMALGPFARQEDLRLARTALASHVQRMRARKEQVTKTRAWWVHLPASPDQAAALAQARRLDASHIKDYLVVNTGDHQAIVSVGVFKALANARKRRDEIIAAGFPAKVSEHSDLVPEYWLDVIPSDNTRLEWRRFIHDPAIRSRRIGCF